MGTGRYSEVITLRKTQQFRPMTYVVNLEPLHLLQVILQVKRASRVHVQGGQEYHVKIPLEMAYE